MISKLIYSLVGWVIPTARTEVSRVLRAWMARSPGFRFKRPSTAKRLLHWGSIAPVEFSLFVAGVLFCVGTLVTSAALAHQTNITWLIHLVEALRGYFSGPNFDAATYLGVPLSAQATLLALVYPIVISFVALMLQKQQRTTVSLRVYVLSSGVIPAGISAVTLTLVLSVGYFFPPLLQELGTDLFPAAMVASGMWFSLNLVLTGSFLASTVHFLDDKKRQEAAQTLALHTALPGQISELLVGPFAERMLRLDIKASTDESQPRVAVSVPFFKEVTQVSLRKSKEKDALDVLPIVLRAVAASWSFRARRASRSAVRTSSDVLRFPLRLGAARANPTTLCEVSGGTPLNVLERVLVRLAHVRARTPLHDSILITRMLEEIRDEAIWFADSGQFEQAREAVSRYLALLRVVFQSADFSGLEAAAGFTLTQDLLLEWIQPIRALQEKAAKEIERDTRLVEYCAIVPIRIAELLPVANLAAFRTAFLLVANLDYQIGLWWEEKTGQVEKVTEVATPQLSERLNKVYDSVLAHVVGYWSSLHLPLAGTLEQPEAQWENSKHVARVYAQHILVTARLAVRGLDRADATAAERYIDLYMKWWGVLGHRLAAPNSRHRASEHGLDITTWNWERARVELHTYGEQVSLAEAIEYLPTALKKYWEMQRALLILVCLQRSNSEGASLMLKLVHALCTRKPLRRGARIDAAELSSLDAGMVTLLRLKFADPVSESLAESFIDSLGRDDTAPDVPGWVFTSSSQLMDSDSLIEGQAKLLVALADARNGHTQALRIVHKHWNSLRVLSEMERYFKTLRRVVSSCSFKNHVPQVQELRSLLGKTNSVAKARLAVSKAAKQLAAAASRERLLLAKSLQVDESAVAEFVRKVSAEAFGAEAIRGVVGKRVVFRSTERAPTWGFRYRTQKLNFVRDPADPNKEDEAPVFVAETIFEEVVTGALFEYLGTLSPIIPLGAQASGGELTFEDAVDFLRRVLAACREVQAAGMSPIILSGLAASSSVFEPWFWINREDGKSLPADLEDNWASSQDTLSPHSYLCGFPVFERDTPFDACFVVGKEHVETLVVEASGAEDALSANWSVENDLDLSFAFRCKARLTGHSYSEDVAVNGISAAAS